MKQSQIYDLRLTYEENFLRKLPEYEKLNREDFNSLKKDFLGKKVLPLKLSAGPCLNSNYAKVFSDLGYGIITYKTVRSYEKEAFPFPNIIFKGEKRWILPENYCYENIEKVTITNSFGMPSSEPEFWKKDVNKARKLINKENILVLSIVGDNSEDFIKTAEMASETTCDAIELDLSCPNVKPLFYLNTVMSRKIIKGVRKFIKKPLILKIGFLESKKKVEEFLSYVDDFDAIEAINGLQIKAPKILYGRKITGICGEDIKEYGLKNISWLSKIREKNNLEFKIIGVGGIFNEEDAKKYFDSGADIIGTATGAMFDSSLSKKIYQGI